LALKPSVTKWDNLGKSEEGLKCQTLTVFNILAPVL